MRAVTSRGWQPVFAPAQIRVDLLGPNGLTEQANFGTSVSSRYRMRAPSSDAGGFKAMLRLSPGRRSAPQSERAARRRSGDGPPWPASTSSRNASQARLVNRSWRPCPQQGPSAQRGGCATGSAVTSAAVCPSVLLARPTRGRRRPSDVHCLVPDSLPHNLGGRNSQPPRLRFQCLEIVLVRGHGRPSRFHGLILSS